MKITYQQAMQIAAGLRNLDGYDKIIKDGEKERTVRELYKLGGGFRLLAAKNQNFLDVAIKHFQDARNALIISMRVNGEIPPDKVVEFANQERSMLEEVLDIPLITFKSDQLKLEQNPIQISTLTLIQLLLEDQNSPPIEDDIKGTS